MHNVDTMDKKNTATSLRNMAKEYSDQLERQQQAEAHAAERKRWIAAGIAARRLGLVICAVIFLAMLVGAGIASLPWCMALRHASYVHGPWYCPHCGGNDLYVTVSDGQWHCRCCREAIEPAWRQDVAVTTPTLDELAEGLAAVRAAIGEPRAGTEPAPEALLAEALVRLDEIRAAVMDATGPASPPTTEHPASDITGMDDLWEFMTPEWYLGDWEATDKSHHPEKYISQPRGQAGEPGIDDGIY